MYMHTNKEIIFYFLELPEHTRKFIFDIGAEHAGHTNTYSLFLNLPEGRYEILGPADRLLGHQWEEIVEESEFDSTFGFPLYPNYMFPGVYNQTFAAPRDSGLSLLESVGLKPGTFIIKKK